MTQEERLARNIWSLRNAFGETEEDLGAVLGFGKSAINHYETGRNKPKAAVLTKIAEHYMVSVGELLNNDFSGLLKVNPDSEKLKSSIRVILPIVRTDSAMRDKAFIKGFEAHRSMYECFSEKNSDIDHIEALGDNAFEAYLEVGDEAEDASAANLLALWILQNTSIFFVPDLLKAGEAMSKSGDAMSVRGNALVEKLMKSDPDFEQEVKKYRGYVLENPTFEADRRALIQELGDREIEEVFIELFKRLKESSRLYYLADYYLALRFIYNMVPNGLDTNTNRTVGTAMMTEYSKLGNPAAKRFFRFIGESWRPEHA